VLFFGVAVIFTYLLAALSFGAWSKAMNRPVMKLIVLLGLNYILLAFASDFLRGTINALGPEGSRRAMAEYLPFATLCVAAPLLRILAARSQPKPALAE
jgi:hypothetical protein